MFVRQNYYFFRLFQHCVNKDFLHQMNLKARDRMRALGADLTYTEGPGGHDWNFWDQHIQKILDWLLEGREIGKSTCAEEIR